MKSALIIEDCPEYSEIISIMFNERDYAVWAVESITEAFLLLTDTTFDLILCDLHLPFTTGHDQADYEYSHEVGIRTAEELWDIYAQTPIVLSSATPRSTLDFRINRFPFLQKPFRGEQLDSLLESLSTKRTLS